MGERARWPRGLRKHATVRPHRPHRPNRSAKMRPILFVAFGLSMLAVLSTSSSATTPELGWIRGVVGDIDGTPVAGVTADLFTANPSGGREVFIRSTTTNTLGQYRMRVGDGCYVVVLIAPDDQPFTYTGRFHQASVCLVGGRANRSVDGLLDTAATTIRGRVEASAGGPAPQIVVDLYNSHDGRRAEYIASTTTGETGTFSFAVPARGCYEVVIIAPRGTTVLGGSRYHQDGVCIGTGDHTGRVDAVITSAERGEIGGRITYRDELGAGGLGAEDVAVDLFRAAADGTRADYLGSTTSDIGGFYHFDVAQGCYVVVIMAPSEGTFTTSGQFHQSYHEVPFNEMDVCVDAGEIVTSLDGSLDSLGQAPSDLSAIEVEIYRLTNELRADPSGPLGRRKPMPDCVDESFYQISVAPDTGHPEPTPALKLDENVSMEMARAWAVDMQQRDRFRHRPTPAQQQIYDRLDIPATAWGENIAWFSGYGQAETAKIHFEGWRESDSGHYCSLITPRFTSVGIGEHHIGDESWAVQNFYATR